MEALDGGRIAATLRTPYAALFACSFSRLSERPTLCRGKVVVDLDVVEVGGHRVDEVAGRSADKESVAWVRASHVSSGKA